ncbi:30S ribosomal protein S12 methylthiotransferase RimO [Longicatena caecimuris]|uniref:Ribosomal protein uS12 methylthiotransferase RimO n=1 Tax=Longicatena caecimuris TaxID=1796635 RepID=A0A4R3TLT4_9FIRM|nr:30S ribosomal protein S12 methylthiotransferase RimO [Longicatena caecimuris]MCR1869442.1 30S ribosomal protein S12 methylthiotransferase RimO [Longicatena caecimuris]MCU0102072.1 30S ribosomal protein S12 methylthiotransferase RimO [Longicatena caecimuris]TCU62629.1 ribosomal protein S12 methylthiotransferase [Longicatena caecimuris]
MKIGFISLGCSKNLVDSEKMMGMLKSGHHELVKDAQEAEAIIINTCGFINSAKEEAINTIFKMAEYKKQNCKKLIVVGCLAQRYKETLEAEIPEIDAVISIREYPHLHEILHSLLDGKELVSYGKSERMVSSKPWTAYLKIAEGCSNRCTYCAIPLIRGDNVTFPMEQLVQEAKELAQRDVKELVLIAQDTTKYGVDLYGKRSLLELLQKLHEIDGFHWIRILYMYPDEIDEDLIEGMAKLSKVLPYFDIPMQHANNRMLAAMNRRGTKEEVLALIKKIRKTYADPTLRTTFIVGFPSETQEDFDELMQFVEEVHWDRMGAFTYSPEEDTPAFDMEQSVAEEEKQRRLAILMQRQEEISLANQQKRIGTVMEVLVEAQDGLTGKYRGRGANSAPDEVDGMVIFTSKQPLALGSFVQVKITEALPHDVIGEALC